MDTEGLAGHRGCVSTFGSGTLVRMGSQTPVFTRSQTPRYKGTIASKRGWNQYLQGKYSSQKRLENRKESDSIIYKEADSSMHKDSYSWIRRRNERTWGWDPGNGSQGWVPGNGARWGWVPGDTQGMGPRGGPQGTGYFSWVKRL